MAINWDLYNKRLNVNGSSERERNIKSIQSQIINHLPHSPSYKNVVINGTNRNIAVIKTTVGYKKQILSLPSETFDIGDYVVFESKTYLITEIDNDKEVYTSGKMQECNFVIKWQNSTGTILSYPCITSNKSFNQDESNIITLGDNQKSILLPYDENTSLLSVDKRMYVDKRNQTPYKIISDIDTTSYNYGEKGLIYFVMEQDESQLTDGEKPKDRPDLGICNYFSPTVPPTPSPSGYTMTITPSMDLTVNSPFWCSFTPVLKDASGNIINGWTGTWSFGYNGMDQSKFSFDYDGDVCKIKVADENYDVVDNSIMLTCTSDNGNVCSYNATIVM